MGHLDVQQIEADRAILGAFGRKPCPEASLASSGTNFLRPDFALHEAHKVCRPVEDKVKRWTTVREEVTLPLSVARIYLSLGGGWNLPVSKGFCAASLLSVDGSINCSAGYDRASGLWCLGTDAPPISSKPTTEDARNLLRLVRGTFASFPFADPARLEANGGGSMLDVSKDPGADESAFLMALMTAVCRPSLPLAPALLIRAPQLSGSGTGKGLLVRAIGETAFGRRPKAFARGVIVRS